MKRIDSLDAGTKVTLRFNGSKSLGNEPYEQEVVFLRIQGTGESREAVFGLPQGSGHSVWHAYRVNGSWRYGTSSERLSLVKVHE